MALYAYQKVVSTPRKKAIGYISYMSLTIGALLLFWSLYPVLSFEIYSKVFIQPGVTSPVPRSETTSSLEQANSVLGSYNIFSNNLRDFTQASLWFPSTADSQPTRVSSVTEYYLSIPKLNIKDAHVDVGGEDLTNSLVQYLPRSIPGEYGNAVVFGHSTLPQLYNVKDYKTIFTYLPSLEKGDKIDVKIGTDVYEYEVYDMFVVKPEQISVLDEQNDGSYLTLITCVPPGTYWNRLVVKAKMKTLAAKSN